MFREDEKGLRLVIDKVLREGGLIKNGADI